MGTLPDFVALVAEGYDGVWRHGFGDEDIGSDGAAAADGDVADDGGRGVESDVVFEGGVAAAAAEALSGGEGAGDEADSLIEFDVMADAGGFADDDAGAVVDEEVFADDCAWVDVDAGAGVGPFRHHAWDEGEAHLVEDVGHALRGDGFEAGVGENDFVAAAGGRVAIEGGPDILVEEGADGGDLVHEAADEAVGHGGGIVWRGWLGGEAGEDLVAEPLHDVGDPAFGQVGNVFGLDGFRFKEAWEEDFEKVAAEGGDGTFRREVGAVEVVDAAEFAVGSEKFVGDAGGLALHGSASIITRGWRKKNAFRRKLRIWVGWGRQSGCCGGSRVTGPEGLSLWLDDPPDWGVLGVG